MKITRITFTVFFVLLLCFLCGCGVQNTQESIVTSPASKVQEQEAESKTETENAHTLTAPDMEVKVVSEGTEGDFTYTVMSDDTVTIIRYTGDSQEVEIPASIQGMPVRRIGSEAFVFNDVLVSVQIPEGITFIGEEAFYGCESLTSVTLSDSLREIDYKAFYATPWLDSLAEEFVIVGQGILLDYNGEASTVVVPDGVTMISSAFTENSSIVHVELPHSVIKIGRGAFLGCFSLESIIMQEGLVEIGDSAFYSLDRLGDVTIPTSVTEIGAEAFRLTSWLENMTEEFVIVGQGVLLDYNGSDTSVYIPEGVKMISTAFYYCKSLESVNIPEGVEIIGNEAFYGCESLKSVTFPDSLRSIGEDAFSLSTLHENITIPRNVTSIGEGNFFSSYVLHVYEGSYAHIWAEEERIPYELVK